jgi:hypothetical protein
MTIRPKCVSVTVYALEGGTMFCNCFGAMTDQAEQTAIDLALVSGRGKVESAARTIIATRLPRGERCN